MTSKEIGSNPPALFFKRREISYIAEFFQRELSGFQQRGDLLDILPAVDVEKDARIGNFHCEHLVRMRGDDVPRAFVTRDVQISG